ncbi:MAG: hypothetical protein KatS3mg015_2559 [Fimbriimonadales bacterium]|nr:MAG: hypothetical protein KatS3mg015_2559 [Fimbriimonadales bacterium]
MNASGLNDLCGELLDACVRALDTIPAQVPGLEGAPLLRYVSPGEPAADCPPQLTVHVSSLDEASTEPGGLGAGRRASYGRINHATLIATLFRCVPTGSETKTKYVPPDAISLEQAAKQINADGWALWNHLYNEIRAGLLFSLCQGVFWMGMRSLPPQGGAAGLVLALRIALDGYEETLP